MGIYISRLMVYTGLTLKPQLVKEIHRKYVVNDNQNVSSFFNPKIKLSKTMSAVTLLVKTNPNENEYQHTYIIIEYLSEEEVDGRKSNQDLKMKGLKFHFVYDKTSPWHSIGRKLFGKGLVVGRGMEEVNLKNLSMKTYQFYTVQITREQQEKIRTRILEDKKKIDNGECYTYSQCGTNASGTADNSDNCFTYCIKVLKEAGGVNIQIPWWLWRIPIVLPSKLLQNIESVD